MSVSDFSALTDDEKAAHIVEFTRQLFGQEAELAVTDVAAFLFQIMFLDQVSYLALCHDKLSDSEKEAHATALRDDFFINKLLLEQPFEPVHERYLTNAEIALTENSKGKSVHLISADILEARSKSLSYLEFVEPANVSVIQGTDDPENHTLLKAEQYRQIAYVLRNDPFTYLPVTTAQENAQSNMNGYYRTQIGTWMVRFGYVYPVPIYFDRTREKTIQNFEYSMYGEPLFGMINVYGQFFPENWLNYVLDLDGQKKCTAVHDHIQGLRS